MPQLTGVSSARQGGITLKQSAPPDVCRTRDICLLLDPFFSRRRHLDGLIHLEIMKCKGRPYSRSFLLDIRICRVLPSPQGTHMPACRGPAHWGPMSTRTWLCTGLDGRSSVSLSEPFLGIGCDACPSSCSTYLHSTSFSSPVMISVVPLSDRSPT